MAKRIEKDGKFYRMRRGKLVEIPSEWVGQTTHEQTKRKRRSTRKKGNEGWGKTVRVDGHTVNKWNHKAPERFNYPDIEEFEDEIYYTEMTEEEETDNDNDSVDSN